MEKLPISLCVITRNSGDRIRKMLEYHKDIVSEILVIDQDSTDNTREEAGAVADIVIRKSCKGVADPDRNWLFNFANCPWILYLDDDERLHESLIRDLKDILENDADIFWIKEQNFVDGVDIREILGDDPHPRLFKKGSVIFPDKIHTWPQPANNAKVCMLNYYIVHERSLDKIKAANRGRNVIATPEMIKMQEDFISKVENYISKKELQNAVQC